MNRRIIKAQTFLALKKRTLESLLIIMLLFKRIIDYIECVSQILLFHPYNSVIKSLKTNKMSLLHLLSLYNILFFFNYTNNICIVINSNNIVFSI